MEHIVGGWGLPTVLSLLHVSVLKYKEIVTGIYNSPVLLEMKNISNKSMRNIRKKCVQVKSAYLYV